MSFITGVGLTSFGKHEGKSTLDLMSIAAEAALADAQLRREDIDAVVCGYSIAQPHIMLATVFCEHFGLVPQYAHAVQVGGATGMAMAMLAHILFPPASRKTCSSSPAKTVSAGRPATAQCKLSHRSGIRYSRFRWGQPFRRTTALLRRATCTNTASRRRISLRSQC